MCGECLSLNLNKSTSYLSLCLSLTLSQWHYHFVSHWRTWASLGPETRYGRFWLDSSPSHVGSSPKQCFDWVWVPDTWVQVPIWGKWFQCLTLCDPMYWGLPGSSLHGILQARILEWVAVLFSRGSSQPRDWTKAIPLAKFGLAKPLAEEPEIELPHPLDHRKIKRVPKKHLFLPYWLRQSLWLCGSQ